MKVEANFMYNGIKVDGKLYKGSYSVQAWTDERHSSPETIRIYASNYKGFPKIDGLQITNDSDAMTDYFEEDRIDVRLDNRYYAEVKAAYDKQEAHRYGTRKNEGSILQTQQQAAVQKQTAEPIGSIDGHIAEVQKEQPGIEKLTEPQQTAPALDMPDTTITVKEMQEHGYDWDGMLPLHEDMAIQLFENDDVQIFRLYEDGSEGVVDSVEEMREHAERGGIFGIEKNDWTALYEYKAMQRDLAQSEASKTALLLYGKEDTFGIYQLKGGDEMRNLRFEPYDRLQAAGLALDTANYELTYTAPFENGMSLDGIFEKFNLDRPADFTGYNLSVSDVVVLHQDGQNTAHYVDSFGYIDVPQFLQPELILDAEQEQPTFDAEQPDEAPQPETSVTYYPIDEAAARRAKEANSYSEYKPGSVTAEYQQSVDEAIQLAERQKSRVDPMYHEKIDRLLDTYARKLAENMNNGFAIDSRVPSIMIAGSGNFPVRQKEKQNAARDKNMGEWRDIQGLLEKIRSTGMGGISADDSNAIDKLGSKLTGLEKSQETMKAVNAYYRKYKTLDGCTLMSPENMEKLKASMSRSWREDAKPFETWELSNNSAEIRRTAMRIEELTHREETPLTGWEFDGGRVAANKEDNRLQVFFEKKPDEGKRTELKKGGFRWAPSIGAWQRQLTDNAFYAANNIKCIQPITGERPTDLQLAKDMNESLEIEARLNKFVFKEFDGGRVVADTENMRLQILFDKAPNEDVGAQLRKEGFLKHYKDDARWERNLNKEALSSFERLALSPSEVNREQFDKFSAFKSKAAQPVTAPTGESPAQQRLFVDMDGTLAVFTPTNRLETLYEKGYFENLAPMDNVVAAVKLIVREHPEIEVNILSAHLSDSPYALAEKNAWLDKNLPEIDGAHRIFPPCGTDKKDYIPQGLRENDFLLDDYTHNLSSWEPPARGIKLLNGINHTHGTWQRDRISFDRPPRELAGTITSVMEGKMQARDYAANQAPVHLHQPAQQHNGGTRFFEPASY